jgi:hypothetical protein
MIFVISLATIGHEVDAVDAGMDAFAVESHTQLLFEQYLAGGWLGCGVFVRWQSNALAFVRFCANYSVDGALSPKQLLQRCEGM